MRAIIQENFVQLAFDSIPNSDEYVADRVRAAVEELSRQAPSDATGAVYTRPEVVAFILDLVGYTKEKDLCATRLLEPSFGHGEFLLGAVSRLIKCWRAKKGSNSVVVDMKHAIRAVELHQNTFDEGRARLIQLLELEGVNAADALSLAKSWLIRGDFLLAPIEGEFDFVIGNPPYVRQELIPPLLVEEYRRRYRAIYDRADLYIPFIERSLSMLSSHGELGFICADRWMKNRYGGPLRRIISERFNLDIYVDMTDTPAFTSDVMAYPAITVISRGIGGVTRISHRPEITSSSLALLAQQMRADKLDGDVAIREMSGIARGSDPWLLELPGQMALIRRLERAYPSIEEAGCRVGIGVATGADKVFIGKFDELDVEESRKLPLATTRDVVSGEVQWIGLGVINPYGNDGKLINLSDFPRLAAYLEARKGQVAHRHCAQKNPETWYRTIDKITPSLADQPKLLIPDIKGEAHVVYEQGKLYPHHNLYYITASEWNLLALQAVLLSDITKLFITTYSTKMRGGYLRFQAQYLRRLRIPKWRDVPVSLRESLCKAGKLRDVEECNRATFELYGLAPEERASIGGNGA